MSLSIRPAHLATAVATALLLALLLPAPGAAATTSGAVDAPGPLDVRGVVDTAVPADQIQWSVMPSDGLDGQPRSRIDYTLEPGTSVTDSVVVTNSGEEPVQLTLQATDAMATAEGAFAVLPPQETPVQLGSWIALETDGLTLGPGESREVDMTITIPQDASPGDHAAGVMAARRTSVTTAEGTDLSMNQRVGARVYVRVNGPLQPELTVTSMHVTYDGALFPLRRPPATIEYTITNTGNLRLAGQARVHLLAPFGWDIAQSPVIDVPAMLPGSATSGRVQVTPPWPPGRLTARMEVDGVNTAGTVPVQIPHAGQAVTIWAMPWLVLGGVVLLVALWWLRRRRIKTLIRRAASNRHAGDPQETEASHSAQTTGSAAR